MRKRRISAPAAANLALLITLGMGAPSHVMAQGTQAAALPPVTSLPTALEAVLRGYEDAWSARDAVALSNLFTSDGFVLRPGHPPVRGRESIREAYANSGGPLSLRAYAYQVDGAVGYIIGGYSAGPDRPAVGKFVLALRRASSGTWLIAADIDNGN
jgi:ketosteroid isomerase-like protein